MGEVCDRCVVLKGLPNNCSEDTVNEVLELAHDDFRFKDKYEKLSTYKPTEDEVRWIVLFKTARDAELCIQAGKWLCNTEIGRHEVIPDLCSDCIIPDEWILNDDWVVTDSLKGTNRLSANLSTGSFVAVGDRGSNDFKSSSGESGCLDDSTEYLQGAVGGSNVSTASDHNLPVPKARSKHLEKQTPCSLIQDTDLIQTKYMFGSGQEKSTSPIQSIGSCNDLFGNDTVLHDDQDYEENYLLNNTLENTVTDKNNVQDRCDNEEANHEPAQYNSVSSVKSSEMFGSGSVRPQVEASNFDKENTFQEEFDEKKNSHTHLFSGEAVVKSVKQQMEQVDVNKNMGQTDAHENTEQNDANENMERNDANENTEPIVVQLNIGLNDAKENTVQTDVNENMERTDVTENMRQTNAHENTEQKGAIETKEQNDAHENKEQNDTKEKIKQKVENENAEQRHTNVNRTDIKFDPQMTGKDNMGEESSTGHMHEARYQHYDFPPMGMPMPMPGQYYPYHMPMPYMMVPPPAGKDAENNTGNAPSEINPEYFYSYMPYQIPPMREPMYVNQQQAYQMRMPYPFQAYPFHGGPIPIVRPNIELEQRLQEGNAGAAEEFPIYDEVKPGVRHIPASPTSPSSQSQNNTNINTEWRHSGGSGLTNTRQSGKVPVPATRKRPKTDRNIQSLIDKENNTHQKHFHRQHSGDTDNNEAHGLQHRQSSHSLEDDEESDRVEATNTNPDYESLPSLYGSVEHIYDEMDRQTSDNKSPQTEIKRPPIPAPRKTLQSRKETDEEDVPKHSSALPIYDSSGSDERKAIRRTILVKGLTEDISQEILVLFFENKSRSGGGEIKDVTINKKKREAIISFCNDTDALTVLSRARSGATFTVSEVPLEVCEYRPPLLNSLMLFMTNIAETTSEECIRNFVEAKIHSETEHIDFGETPGTAMLHFKSPPDTRALQQICKERQCDGAFLNISTVEKSKTIRVTGFNHSTSTEALGLYFENKRRSKGGNIEEVRSRQNVDGDTEYVVTFVNYEDAERVCDNESHYLDGKQLTVCLHYTCMELDDDALPMIPKPVTFDEVDKYVLKFIRLSAYYHQQLEEKITEIHGMVVWNQSDESLVIECIVDPKDRGRRLKVKNWTEKCDKIVKTMFGEIVIEESTKVACEVFEELMIRLRSIDVSNPDKVSVFLDKDECYIIMVGTSDLVKLLVEKIKTLVEETERNIYDDNQIITQKRKLPVYQMALLRATKFDEKLKASIGVLEIDYENRECIFKGRQKDVGNGLEELKKRLETFVSKHITDFPMQATELTFKKEARDYVKSKFYKEKLIGIWHTTRSKQVFMYGRSEKEVNKATKIFLSSIAVTPITLDSAQATILSSQEGQDMISEIERKNEGLVQVLTDLPKSVTVVSIDKIHDEVKAEIEKLFDVHTIVKEFLPTQPGRLEFVKTFQRTDLSTIEGQYQRLKVQITIADNRKESGFHVTGKKDGCKLALNKLQKMLDAVQCNIITKSWPGFDLYLSTDEGGNCIQQLEVQEKCVVKVMAEKIKQVPSANKDDVPVAQGVQRAEGAAGKITIQIVTGSLVDENVDVVVNSTNKDIDLTVGMVARTLRRAGGVQLEAECKQKYPNGIAVGDLAVTKASGTLKCRVLFHGLLVKWDNGQGYSKLIMEQFIDKCLQKADRKRYTSIAFPALGTGALKFPADAVANIMFNTVKGFETTHPDTSIKDVHFVVWEGDQPTVKAFQQEHSLNVGKLSSSDIRRSSRSSYVQPDTRANVFDTSSGFSTSVDKVAVSVSQGDLTKAKTGAIVNSTIDDLNLNSGNISKAILHAAGPSIQLEANAHKRSFLDEGLVVTQSGKLYCQRIIHVRARNSERTWHDTIVSTLETVENLGLTSVAFPALGTGGKGFQPETMAKVMIQALQKFKSKTTGVGCLKSIQIIVYESSMVVKFVKGIQDTLEPSTKRFSALKFWHNKSEPTAKITMQVYAESSFVLEKVATKIDEIRQQETIMFSVKAAESLDDTKSKDLLALKQIYGVDVEIAQGRVLITGFGRNVKRAVNSAKRYVEKIEADVNNSITESTVALPKEWSKMSLFELFKVFALKSNAAEYVSIARKFAAETGLPATNIQKIERIQNTTLYTQYISMKRQMEVQNKGGTQVERILWHGTRSDVVDKINEFGFNRNYNSGASHGAGVYFAVNASTSAQGYCRPDVYGNKHIYLAYVLTGDYAVGSQGIKFPPLNPNAPGRTCDSTTDNVQNPNFFVTFHDAQAYPAFHIVFK